MRTFTRKVLPGIAAAIVLAMMAAVAMLEWRFAKGRERIDQEWAGASVQPLDSLGATRRLEILPLIDESSADAGLQTEAGVSYLVRTDHNTILFDVGLNALRGDPSPLQANMKRLGIALADIDTIVISHPHLDHVGGLRWARRSSFSLGDTQVDLGGKRIFVPVPMTYSGAAPVVAGAPLFGLVGGLHYPVPNGRFVLAGGPVQEPGDAFRSPLSSMMIVMQMDV